MKEQPKEKPKEHHLPRLRQDLQLNPAPAEEGAPTWTLYDPGANKYYKIGWMEFECLTRFPRCKTAQELSLLVARETTLEPTDDDIILLVNFLFVHGLVQSDTPAFVEYLQTQKEKRDKPFWERLMHGYLYFTLPLFRPQKFLRKTYPYVAFMFTRRFFTGVLILLGYGIYLSIQRFDELGTTFMSYFNMEGAFYFLLASVIVKVVHEMGHAYMATRYGVAVNTMGVAVMVLYPVLYAETSNSWRMQDRRQRINISMAGVMAEMTLASVALIMWHMLPPGMAQGLCFLVAVVSLIASLVVNTNPLMRFDGYYLMSDLSGIDNLQDRSLAHAKWKIRGWLFGWDDGPPEPLPVEKRNFLTIFGLAIIAYRFVLFVGIAFLVYFLFFKPLGLILFLVEVFFFLLMPVVREVRVWCANAGRIAASWRGRGIIVLLVAALAFSFVPAQGSVEVPAVLHAGNYKRIFPITSAQIVEIAARQGSHVREGQVLYRLNAPDLDRTIAKSQIRLEALQTIKAREQATQELVRQRPTLDADIEAARKELEGNEAQKKRLTIEAPFDGILRDVDPAIREGMWVNPMQMLGVVVGPDSLILSGYVSEHDVPRIAKQAQGWFYADYTPFARFPVMLKKIEATDSRDIYWPELAAPYGGPLPAERGQNGYIRPLPHHPLYAAQFELQQSEDNTGLPSFTAPGVVRLEAAPESMMNLMAQRFLSLVMRESGF